MSAPQVFISSTLQELKYIREGLERFLENNGWSPIFFERGDIVQAPQEKIDESCLRLVDTSSVFILIIGQSYGKSKTECKRYKESISITHAEYRRAIEQRIPIYCFIERDVWYEYRSWAGNDFKDGFITNTDHRCLELVREVFENRLQFPVKQFERSEDIQNYLTQQWVGLLARYLREEQRTQGIDGLNRSIARLEKTSSRLEEMVEYLLKNNDKDGAQEMLKKHENRKSKEIRDSILADFLHSNFMQYLERFSDFSDREKIIELITNHELLKDFLSQLDIPEAETKYVLGYQGSHETYQFVREQVCNR